MQSEAKCSWVTQDLCVYPERTSSKGEMEGEVEVEGL